jgi:phospholipid/cholesterol/gamma-HCH transport system substrate-binding protein
MESRSHAFFAGLFVILLVSAAIAGALWLGRPKGPKLMPVDLLTRHSVVGLKADAPVRFRGVDIGRVESIAFDPRQRGEIRVRIDVDPAAPLTNSTFAKLSYQGITGVAFIQLDDVAGTQSTPLVLSGAKVAQLEMQASLLETAEVDLRDVVLKTGRVATRIEELLSEQNQKRLMALVDSVKQTVDRYGTLSRDLEPTVKTLPSLVQRAEGTVASVSRLADDVDGKLAVLNTVAAAVTQVQGATEDLRRDTLPRVNAALDEVTVDARELKHALHQVDARPQSLLFGLQPPPAGPGEPGFTTSMESAK